MSNGLNNVMLLLAKKQKTNKALIDGFNSVQNPDTTPYPHIKVANYHYPAKPLIGSLYACFPDTSVKLQSIIHNNKKLLHTDSHPDQGRTSILAPNNYAIQDVISDVQSKVASTTSGFE